ncbi:MAG: chain-length determining protein [Prevotella sp.]|nr:chain-length determining protein [Prevotella sp.]
MIKENNKGVKPIDLVAITQKLWQHRRLFYRVLPATVVITYLIILCIPRYYRCTVSLAPEANTPSMTGSLGSLASSIGLGGSLAKMAANDAISAEIYPDVIASKNFIAELMTVQVNTQKDSTKFSYYIYLRDKQKEAWWNKIRGVISEWIKPTPKDTYDGGEELLVFNLTKQQSEIFSSVQDKIKCTIDKKTDVVSITFEDQDPLVCATMADATCQKLQEFIVKYRTTKARIDYEYYKKLYSESEAEYEKAMQQYSDYADAHKSAVLASYQSQLENLENNMQAKYNIFTAMNTQMQAAAAKLQEATPAFTVIESASIPIKPAGPKRMLIAFGMMILVFIVMSLKLLLSDASE